MLANHLARACVARRERLRQRLGPVPAIIPAGSAPPRNYAANAYPFRASSHFLYLVGLPFEGALLFVDQSSAALLLPDAHADDDLWHGPTPSPAEIARALRLEVLSRASLSRLLAGRRAMTTPPLGAAGERLSRELDRSPETLGAEEHDAPLLDALVSMRLCHDDAALDELRRAANVSVRAHLAGMRATRAGRYEREICAAMEATFYAEGFGTAYNSIVSVHGEVLHNHRHDQRVEDGQLVLADVGAETDTGYASDITRTWPVSGKFSATQRDVYTIVLEAQRTAIAEVRPGRRYRDVHLAAARTITEGLVSLGVLRGQVDALVEDGAHALFFPHGIGHLLGLDVHDMEDLGDRAGYAPGRARSSQFGLGYLRLDRDLVPGMLVTIEPGFYQVPSLLREPERVGISRSALDLARLAWFADVRGIRIEDDVLVTQDGSDILTGALPKAPSEIEALVSEAHVHS